MGMGLNGKELGEGIAQKKNGKYIARCRTKAGDRVSKTFTDIVDAKEWLKKTKAIDILSDSIISPLITVSCWFNFWIETFMSDLRINTRLSYISKYNTWIEPVLGKMRMVDVMPYNCMEVLNNIQNKGRKASTLGQVRIVMHLMFDYAVENKVIKSNPVTRTVKFGGKITPFQDTRFLTRSEQKIFLEEAYCRRYYNQFAFILQTGLRYGELTALRWPDIDGRIMHITKSAGYLEDHGEFVVGDPKSANGFRDIYLTDKALEILDAEKKLQKKVSTYDSSLVFLGLDGKPVKRANYNIQLKRICEKIGIKPFSIHKLRHSFACRCIESGMKPKTLQKILGHSDVTITLNYYVHVSDNELISEMDKFSSLAL